MADTPTRSVFQILTWIAAAVILSVFLFACVLPVVGISGLSCLGSSLDARFEEEAQRRNSTEIAIDAIEAVEARRR